MVQPPPHKLKCIKCGYSKVVKPKSDALDPTDFIGTCPKCGGDMEYEELNTFDKLFDLI